MKSSSLESKVSMMCNFLLKDTNTHFTFSPHLIHSLQKLLTPKAAAAVLSPAPSSPSLDNSNHNTNLHELEQEIIAPAEQVNYLSDDWSDNDKSSDDSKMDDENIPSSEQAC